MWRLSARLLLPLYDWACTGEPLCVHALTAGALVSG